MPDPREFHNPHDALIKAVLSFPEEAPATLALVLPAEAAAELDLGTARAVPGSYVDKDFSWRHTDLVFEIGLRAPPTGPRVVALFVLLFEHQSTVILALAGLTPTQGRWLRVRRDTEPGRAGRAAGPARGAPAAAIPPRAVVAPYFAFQAPSRL